MEKVTCDNETEQGKNCEGTICLDVDKDVFICNSCGALYK